MLTTKDPDKAAIRLTTEDPTKGFGPGVMFESASGNRLIDEQKKQKPQAMKKGGVVSSASKRADGCAVRGKTRGKMV
jgi:hypothetical protein